MIPRMVLDMNWRAFDLNLLIVFDAVMQERSVTRAGRRIGLSQPAMSHALARLRHMLKDDLFVRTPDGMRPTARAEQIASPLRNALFEMQRAIEPAIFKPATSDRRFTIAVNNYAAVVMAAPLAAAVSDAAPSITLDLRPRGTLDIVTQLDRGDLDLVSGGMEPSAERFSAALLVEDAFVVVMRRGHPAGKRKLTAKSFAALAHLDVSSSREDTSFIDLWLDQRGAMRRVALRAPYLSIAAILGRSDLVVSLSGRMAQNLVRNQPLQIHKAPYSSPKAPMNMVWHRRFDNHPAHRWLRDIVLSVTKRL